MFEILTFIIVIITIWMAWRSIQPHTVEHVEPRIVRGRGQSIVFDGYKVVQEDGSMNQYLAPEVVRDYLDYIGHE
jgi:hypothetical protein